MILALPVTVLESLVENLDLGLADRRGLSLLPLRERPVAVGRVVVHRWVNRLASCILDQLILLLVLVLLFESRVRMSINRV